MNTHWRRWGAAWILAALFIGSWVGQFATQLAAFTAEQAEHGQPFEWAQFWAPFWSATFENWQSEFLSNVTTALLLQVGADRFFRRSLEDQFRLEQKVDRLLERDTGRQSSG